ncbi:DUF1566 domain-containing protein [Collimonas pratensis]|nr:DUF1566 domain-containing protein [Collimonas pratensis]
MIFGKNGAPNHRLILLPGEATDVSWADAISFAKDVGGDLPTRREQSLLYTNLKEQFKEAWYWSSEQHSGTSNGAWGQVFSLGDQDSNR